jgi:glycerophosphoryl diester phosphodiesterase
LAFPKIIGHRGASHIAPENTMASFEAALKLGVDGIETDVQETKDGQLVLCHDELLNRTTNGKGLIKDYTLKELKELSAGAWFSKEYENERIPLLEELLDILKNRDILINIEIKSGVLIQYRFRRR